MKKDIYKDAHWVVQHLKFVVLHDHARHMKGVSCQIPSDVCSKPTRIQY
jgi:hypothetical protein